MLFDSPKSPLPRVFLLLLNPNADARLPSLIYTASSYVPTILEGLLVTSPAHKSLGPLYII